MTTTLRDLEQAIGRLDHHFRLLLDPALASKLWEVSQELLDEYESVYATIPEQLTALACMAEQCRISGGGDPMFVMRDKWDAMRKLRPTVIDVAEHFREFIIDTPEFHDPYYLAIEKLRMVLDATPNGTSQRPTPFDETPNTTTRRPSTLMSLQQFGNALDMTWRTFKIQAEVRWGLQKEEGGTKYTVDFNLMDDAYEQLITEHAKKITEDRENKRVKARQSASK